MVSLTLSIPKELKKEMDKFEDINWSAVAREAIKQRVESQSRFNDEERKKILMKMNDLLKNSTLTEEDAILLGRDLKKRAFNRRKAKKE